MEDPFQYVEPINSRRERLLRQLPISAQDELRVLQAKYTTFGKVAVGISVGQDFSWSAHDAPPESVEDFKAHLVQALGGEFHFESVYFRTLLDEMAARVHAITTDFHKVCGGNIFEEV